MRNKNFKSNIKLNMMSEGPNFNVDLKVKMTAIF